MKHNIREEQMMEFIKKMTKILAEGFKPIIESQVIKNDKNKKESD